MTSNNDSKKIMVGETAPDFELPDIEMKTHKLSAHQGRNVILAFFPAAESPVCTTEMCTFRDSLQDLKKEGADIIGISIDGPFANKIFTTNRHLNFPLLSDYNRDVIRQYGVIMKDLGPLKDYNAAKRSVFIIDKDRKVRYSWVSDNPLIEPNYEEIKQELKKYKP
jgi:glutaredoxin-dependent peroxiredoxin